jgi:predicted ATP-binding protein involved in virulence
MSKQDALRIDSLTVSNFRRFRSCSIDLHPSLTVIAAENGQGKSAILDALSIALSPYTEAMTEGHESVGFNESDIPKTPHQNADPTTTEMPSIHASGVADGKAIQWTLSLSSSALRRSTITQRAKKFREKAKEVQVRLHTFASGLSDTAPPLPLIAFYGTGRLWSEHRLTNARLTAAKDTTKMGRVAGYVDCLSPSSSFKVFTTWYKELYTTISKGRSWAQSREHRPQLLLAAVNEATATVLAPTGWKNLGWDPTSGHVTVEHDSVGKMPVDLLSDGVKSITALVADLSHRCVRLNPHFHSEAARLTPGIVLIDEVDMHLHPSWQQRIVPLLATAFPRVQFILTTHSPQVISTVDHKSVRVLQSNDGIATAQQPPMQTQGVESGDVLAQVMGVDPVPHVEQAKWVSRYRSLLQEGQHHSDEGRALREKITHHFGDAHPVVQEIATLERLYAFKNERGLRAGITR